MLSKFINNVINFFYKKRIVFALVILSLLSIFIIGTFKIKINENIFSTLPKGNSFTKFSQLIDQGDLSNQIVFSLKVNDKDVEELEILTNDFSDSLNKHVQSNLKNIVIVRPDIEKKIYNHFYYNFPKFIDDNYYHQIETKIQKDSINNTLANSQRLLLSPGGFFVKEFVLKDPINITGDFFKKLNEETNFSKLNVENGYVFSENKEELLITAKTTFNLSNNKKNVALYHQLNNFKMNWNIHHPNHQVDYFGTFQIGAENSIQIKNDTILTIILTLIVILLILFIFYRKLLIPIYFILPTVFGGLFALGIIGFFKPEISGISLATGAVVFGIILDFSFHFFTHLQHSKSITETIKEVSTPLLTGAFTTIMAFGALLFTNSAVLQDFGLFAALSLIGAALFTLTGLPIFLKVFHFDYSNVKGKNKDFVISIPNRFRKLFLGIVVILTIVFFYFSYDIQFDGDIDNLSFHRQNLKDKEKELMGLNPENEKKLYLFAEANSFEKASQVNYLLFQKIQELQSDKKISSSISISKFIIPDSIATYRLNLWNTFWKTHQTTTFNDLDVVSESLGFNAQAFTPFKEWIVHSNKNEINHKNIINDLGLNDFINEQDTHTTIISSVVVHKKLLSEVQQKLTQINGVSTFNKAEVARDLLAVVKNDFNFIFIISSCLVFISLLIIYGRIELALFTFIPMVISWVWILGMASIFDIKFNFVNIIIATFVFGLGDDFSIFVTDGLLSKYKYKKNTLGSYNTAIILSAITTMVGTGVLFFAKHPAIHSVAIISVLGIFCILVISIILQPFLFDIFIQNRVVSKKNANYFSCLYCFCF
jgi:predicted RND superfamily exporter protein